MAGVDTNVLVRWLVDDDAVQSAQVQRLFELALTNQTRLFVASTVVLELEWVLRSRYGYGKAAISLALTTLLETQEIEIQAEATLEKALHLFRQGGADFADCLHAGLCAAADQSPLLTFDTKAARLPGIKMIAI
jgi:predicted nucleic-acid-binding protein